MQWKLSKEEDGKLILPDDWLEIHYFEVLNILFRVENSLRAFIFIILKNEFQEKWKELSITSDDEEDSTINAIAKRRIAQDKNYAYLGYTISCPLVHLTSGELIRIITSDKYWKFFKAYFPGSKEIIKNKLDEIGNVRNSVAHFRPIKKGDVELIKQNSIHTLSEIEKELSDFISCSDRVPTNSEEEWYKELTLLQNEHCRLSFYQSKNEKWIDIGLHFKGPKILEHLHEKWVTIKTYNLKTQGIYSLFTSLLNCSLTITESTPYIFTKKPEDTEFSKRIGFTFSRISLQKNYKSIKEDIEKIFTLTLDELSLIQQDNLARGKLIEVIKIYLEKAENSDYYKMENDLFKTIPNDTTPPEFWGSIISATKDFISSTNLFPWMPIEISADDNLPF